MPCPICSRYKKSTLLICNKCTLKHLHQITTTVALAATVVVQLIENIFKKEEKIANILAIKYKTNITEIMECEVYLINLKKQITSYESQSIQYEEYIKHLVTRTKDLELYRTQTKNEIESGLEDLNKFKEKEDNHYNIRNKRKEQEAQELKIEKAKQLQTKEQYIANFRISPYTPAASSLSPPSY